MKIIFSCAGTGGHIYPAIAIADRIRRSYPDAEILFIGTKKGMENRIVPAAGYAIKGIDASGISRRDLMKNFRTVLDFIRGGREAKKIIRDFSPDIVIGTGGYVTGAVLTKAHSAGIPCYIQEQNAVPGVANRLLEGCAEKIFLSFESSKAHFRHPEKCVTTGNPIRADFFRLNREECRKACGLEDETMVLLTGGSLGARMLNEAALHLIDGMPGKDIKLFFITGRAYYGDISSALSAMPEELSENIKLIEYADNMPVLMKASDLVISRAGAIALSELLACGRPSVLIPSPNVTNNHQYWNARAVADEGAAVLIEESRLSENIALLADTVFEISSDRELLSSMSDMALRIARTDAADRIFDELDIQ